MYNTITDPKQQALFDKAYATWLRVMTSFVETWRPKMIFVDQEAGNPNYQHMPKDVREMANGIVGSDIPIYHYRGVRFYGAETDETYGSGPCPQIYRLWDKTAKPPVPPNSPLTALQGFLDNPLDQVVGGYPWITPFIDAWNIYKGLTNINYFVAICRNLWLAGAKGFFMYPSAWSKDSGKIDNPIHMILAELMARVVEVWQ